MAQQRAATTWRRLIAEIGVIVGGILIAFAVDASWDRAQATSDLKTSLAAARTDLAASQVQLSENWFRWDEQIAVSAITVLTLAYDVAIEEAPPPGGDRRAWIGRVEAQLAAGVQSSALLEDRLVSVPDSLLGQMLFTPTFDPSMPGVSTLLDSGLLRLAEDQDLVRALAELPGELADLADEEGQARSHVQSALTPALSAENDLAHVYLFTFWGSLGFFDGDSFGVIEERDLGSTELRVSRELVNELAIRVRLALGVLSTVRRVDRVLSGLVEMIDEELGAAS